MIYVFATSRAKDPNMHMSVLSSIKPFMESMGIKALTAFASLEDPTEQHVLFEAPNAEVFTSFLIAPESAEKMQQATLLAVPDIQYMKKLW